MNCFFLQSRALLLARHRQSQCRTLNAHCQHSTMNGEIGNGLEMERGAVGFENYLRGVYGDSPMRKRYNRLIGGEEGVFKPLYFERGGESISNFTSLGNNEKKTSFGFSFDKKTSKKETQKYYIVVSIDENAKFSYQIYTSGEEYARATSNW